MKRVLMVCLGNICRSPLAEEILRSKVNPTEVEVDSAGTSNYHVGEKPDKRSIDVGEKHGLDLTHQRARQFSVSDFDDFDQIFVMDSQNYQNVVKLARTDADVAKVELISNVLHPGQNRPVPDPYYGGDDGFERVFHMLDNACELIAEKLNRDV
jgi:protein-tyrosine phosphatase